jgi:hypothetical protein
MNFITSSDDVTLQQLQVAEGTEHPRLTWRLAQLELQQLYLFLFQKKELYLLDNFVYGFITIMHV